MGGIQASFKCLKLLVFLHVLWEERLTPNAGTLNLLWKNIWHCVELEAPETEQIPHSVIGACWKLHLMFLLTTASALASQSSSSVGFSGVQVEFLANKWLIQMEMCIFILKAVMWRHAGGIQDFCLAIAGH